MKNCISFMLIVVMFGFTSCSNTKDEVVNRLISDKFEKQQYTSPHPRKTSPLTNAIKAIIDNLLSLYPACSLPSDDITYIRRLLLIPAKALDSGSMNAIKNAILNPPPTTDNYIDNIKNELLAINVGDKKIVEKKLDNIRDKAEYIVKMQKFCAIIDCFYKIESIRRDISTSYYDDSNFITLADQLNTVFAMVSEIIDSDSGFFYNKQALFTAGDFLKSLVYAISNHNLDTISTLKDYLKPTY
jgi:hypothetical protein